MNTYCYMNMFCSVPQPSSIRGLATPWMYFLHLTLSSVILTDSSTGSPVHVLMLSIQAVHGLPRLRASGIVFFAREHVGLLKILQSSYKLSQKHLSGKMIIQEMSCPGNNQRVMAHKHLVKVFPFETSVRENDCLENVCKPFNYHWSLSCRRCEPTQLRTTEKKSSWIKNENIHSSGKLLRITPTTSMCLLVIKLKKLMSKTKYLAMSFHSDMKIKYN